jgi:hypothetical protein
MGRGQLGLQREQFGEQARQFDVGQDLRERQFGEQGRQFDVGQDLRERQFGEQGRQFDTTQDFRNRQLEAQEALNQGNLDQAAATLEENRRQFDENMLSSERTNRQARRDKMYGAGFKIAESIGFFDNVKKSGLMDTLGGIPGLGFLKNFKGGGGPVDTRSIAELSKLTERAMPKLPPGAAGSPGLASRLGTAGALYSAGEGIQSALGDRFAGSKGLGDIASGAGRGAAIGSMIMPGAGTAIGGAIGGGYSALKNVLQQFGGGPNYGEMPTNNLIRSVERGDRSALEEMLRRGLDPRAERRRLAMAERRMPTQDASFEMLEGMA